MAAASEPVATEEAPEQIAGSMLARARAAMAAYDNRSQARIDEAVTALAWAIYQPDNARALAELAVRAVLLTEHRHAIVKRADRPEAL